MKPEIKSAEAYVDTITLLSRSPQPKQIFTKVRELQKRALVHDVVDIPGTDGQPSGYKHYYAHINQPKSATLLYVAEALTPTIFLHAVHVAVDFMTDDMAGAVEVQNYLAERLRQTWRRPQDRGSFLDTIYSKEDPGAARNFALYCDRPSKISQQPCCHLELRFTGTDACRRAGLSDLRQLARGIDAFTLLKHQTRLARLDVARLNRSLERWSQKYFLRTRSRHPAIWLNRKTTAPLTRDRLKSKMLLLLERSLGALPGDILAVGAQDLWDSPRHEPLRSALVEVPWEGVTPTPAWHSWR